jgi:hypothetical protein
MLIKEITEAPVIGTDDLKRVGSEIKSGLGKATNWARDQFDPEKRQAKSREKELGKISKQAKEITKEKAKELRDQWVSVASQKGIKWPNPNIDRVYDEKGQATNQTFAEKMSQTEDQAAQDALKQQWFIQQVYNENSKEQDVNAKNPKTRGGFYYGKLRMFMKLNGMRETVIDKIIKGGYPDVPKLDPIATYDNPELVKKHLDKVFIKIQQKTTDYHGDYYGNIGSGDHVAAAKGSIDPQLIDGIKGLSPQQTMALLKVLASKTNTRLLRDPEKTVDTEENPPVNQ